MKNRNQLGIFAAIFAVFFLITLAAGINLYQKNEARKAESADSDKITISFDKLGLVPFDIMVIEGKNLDPDAATSVMLTTFTKQTLIIPALSVSATSVEVPVPPLAYNSDSGHFGIDAIRFKVIQVKKEGDKLLVRTSNEIAGISVTRPKDPSAVTKSFPNKMAKGTLTRAFAALALKRIDALSGQVEAENGELKAAYAETKKGMEQLVAGLDKFIKDPDTKIRLATTGTTTVSIGQSEIAWLDAFYAGFLGLAEERQLLTAEKSHFALIPAAQAAETACESKWQSETDLTKIVNRQLDCLYNKIIADPAGKASDKNVPGSDNWLNKSFRGMQHLALGFTADGLGIDKQIGFAIAGYTGPLNPVMKTLIKPKVAPAPFLLIYLFHETLITVYKHCDAHPDSCYRHNNYTIADPFQAREILFMEYGTPQSLEYRFQTPDEFNTYFYGEDDYDLDLIVEPEPVPAPVFLPEPVTVPRRMPSPAPYNPEPIVDIPPSPAPSPAPVVVPSPTPTPVVKDCWELKDESFLACRAGCSDSQLCYDAYSKCSAGTCNIDCVNACQATLRTCINASSKCFADCNNAHAAYQCP